MLSRLIYPHPWKLFTIVSIALRHRYCYIFMIFYIIIKSAFAVAGALMGLLVPLMFVESMMVFLSAGDIVTYSCGF